MSPSDLGQLIKPFIFLDQLDVDMKFAPRFSWHPHSGIATLTLLFEGGFNYEDSTGATGTMTQGAVEWMQAGGGVWHTGSGTGQRIRGYQLWVALPPELEAASALSRYLDQGSFPKIGPARLILGELGQARSPINSPSPMNYLDVCLRAGDTWRYDPPPGHEVAWVAVHEGNALTPGSIPAGELAIFDESQAPITFRAEVDTGFVLGSAVKHPHGLVMGYYSVHTSETALAQGEMNIRRIEDELRRKRKI
ncbi:MAG TPA: pirin family protein [Steroidobacteraceae bacterium]